MTECSVHRLLVYQHAPLVCHLFTSWYRVAHHGGWLRYWVTCVPKRVPAEKVMPVTSCLFRDLVYSFHWSDESASWSWREPVALGPDQIKYRITYQVTLCDKTSLMPHYCARHTRTECVSGYICNNCKRYKLASVLKTQPRLVTYCFISIFYVKTIESEQLLKKDDKMSAGWPFWCFQITESAVGDLIS